MEPGLLFHIVAVPTLDGPTPFAVYYIIRVKMCCAERGFSFSAVFRGDNRIRQVQIWRNPHQNSNMATTPSPL